MDTYIDPKKEDTKLLYDYETKQMDWFILKLNYKSKSLFITKSLSLGIEQLPTKSKQIIPIYLIPRTDVKLRRRPIRFELIKDLRPSIEIR